VSLRDCNKRVLESFAMAGAFDCFNNTHRAQYFQTDNKERSLVEVAIKYGQSFQERSKSAQVDMFGSADGKLEIPEPIIPACDEWNTYEKLNKEKDVVGIYISGHPLEDYKLELQNFCSINANILSENINQLPEKEFTIIGIANKAVNLQSRRGTRYGVLEIQDMLGSMEFRLFGEQYLKFMHFLVPGNFLSVTGKIQLRPKHYNADGKQKEFNISKIELLKELLEKNVKTIYLRWDSKQLDKLEIDNIDLVFNNHKGKSPVFFELIDQEDKSNVLLTSRDVMLNVSNELLVDLQELPSFLGCSLNKSNLAGYLRSLS
jgi:DNA polymerase-3 subunit alpha